MKRTILVLLMLSTATYGQQKTARSDVTLPAPGNPGTVTLSLAEYNRLSELAAHKPKTVDSPPLPFVLARAVFKLHVDDQSLTGNVDIDGSLLEKGPIKVPLTSGLTILDARQAGSPLPLYQENAVHTAILNGPGAFSVSLNVASALSVEAGRASFIIPVPPAGSSLLTLDLPGSHANVRIEPGLITNRSTANGHTIIEATLDPGKPARVWWTTREISAPVAQREVRFLSDMKTVVSVGDSQLRVVALCDLTVIQGEPAEFRLPIPAGFELTEVNGNTLDSSDVESGELVLRVREPARRNHQFLVAIERANKESKVDAPLLAFSGAQHETGVLLVEGVGAMELTPTESGGLRRMDVREAGAVARSLARYPLQAAFRYNRRPGDAPKLQLEWTQFPDSQVLSAVAERATITTLMTVEGKSLTEVSLRVRNHAQAFVKVELPPGAQLVSSEVEGEKVIPVMGTDGSRVPLLRVGFNPSGPYSVSFVYSNSGTPFAKSGAYEMNIPKLDIPINVLTWEVSLPERLVVNRFGGNALPAELFPMTAQTSVLDAEADFSDKDSGNWSPGIDLAGLEQGQIGGTVVDPNGAAVPGATITVTNKATGTSQATTSNEEGNWLIAAMPPGPVIVTVNRSGFKSLHQELSLSGERANRMGSQLEVSGVSETVTVTASRSNNIQIDATQNTDESRGKLPINGRQMTQLNAPSQNALNLQRRVAGILPVKVDVPQAGSSYRFVRPLVLGEETNITFQYKAR